MPDGWGGSESHLVGGGALAPFPTQAHTQHAHSPPPTTTPPRRYTNKRWYDESGVVAATPDVQPVSAVAARVACAVGPKGKACLLLRQRRRGWVRPLRGAGPPPSPRLSGAATHLPRHTFPLNAL